MTRHRGNPSGALGARQESAAKWHANCCLPPIGGALRAIGSLDPLISLA